MFSKMNSGNPPSNWRLIDGGAVSNGGRSTGGGTKSNGRGDLDRSFRQGSNGQDDDDDDDGYDQEIDEDNEGGEDDDDDDYGRAWLFKNL